MPRMTEESWSIMWNSALEDRLPHHPSGLPIACRIDFDIDLRKALWYDGWVASAKREFDVGVSAPSSILNHHRNGSRSTYATHDLADDSTDEGSVAVHQIQRASFAVRTVPRKLALLERVDSSSALGSLSSTPRKLPTANLDDVDKSLTIRALSPVPQQDEPKSAIEVLENKVNTWRSSFQAPSDNNHSPTNSTQSNENQLPTFPVEPVEDESQGPELNLDDFAWSISSAGPSSPASSVPSSPRVPSVDLARRLEGSVCLTPTTCSSFGPPDYSLSPIESIFRLPTPDIALRVQENVPLTPSTATSWGPPSEWPASPAFISRPPSVDIAARQIFSVPVTPSTATSWGPPLSWPSSPVSTHSRIATPGIDEMFIDDLDPEFQRRAWTMMFTGPLNLNLTSEEHLQHTVVNGDDDPHENDTNVSTAHSSSAEIEPWRFVWPYTRNTVNNEEAEKVQAPSRNDYSGYPWLIQCASRN